MEELDLSALWNSLSALISQWGLKVIGAIAVLVFGWIIAKAIRGALKRGLTRSKLDPTLIPFFCSMVYYLLIAMVVIAVLGLFGIPTTSFVAVVGAAGLAIGLALQGTLSNFAAGVMLLIFRPFRVGDYVEVAGLEGNVHEISIFTTALNTFDNVRIILPNAEVWGATIRNFTVNPQRRIDLPFGISYGDDIGRAREIIRTTLLEDSRVLREPEPLIVVRGLGDSSVDLLVGPWCDPKDYWSLRFDLTRKIKERLESGGCTIPFPQRDVHHYYPEGREA